MYTFKYSVVISMLLASYLPAFGAVEVIHSAQMPVDQQYDSDLHPKMMRMMSGFTKVISPVVDEKIGVCHLNNTSEKSKVLHHFLEWCLLKQARKLSDLTVHAALINQGGIRSDLKSGELFVRDMFNIMPFENELVVVEIKGSIVLKIAQQVQGFSGMSKMLAEPINPDAIYRVATLDYLAEGNGGIPLLKQAERVIPIRMKARDACIQCIKTLSKENQTIEIRYPDAISEKP